MRASQSGSGSASCKMKKNAWLCVMTLTIFLVASVNGGTLHIGTERLKNRTISPTGALAHSVDMLGSTSVAVFQCSREGYFPKSDSCTEFIHCNQDTETGLFNVYLLSCSLGTMFDRNSKTCQTPLQVSLLPDCVAKGLATYVQNELIRSGPETASRSATQANFKDESLPILKRQKRFVATLFAGIGALGGLFSGLGGLIGSVSKGTSQNVGKVLQSIENKLSGVEGKIKNVELTVLESQAENKIRSEIINSLILTSTETSQRNFEVTRKLISQGLLENRFNTAVLQGLIARSSAKNEKNFAKVQVSIGHLKEFVNQEISSAKADIRKGFQSMSNLIDQTRFEPLISKMLTQITNFHQRLNHVESLPEQNIKDEMERSGGFISYLESSSLQGDLYDIIHQNLAVPKDAADLQAIFILELLVQGLQVHSRMLSASVSSNVYLTGKALDERDLDNVNLYISRVSSSVLKVKLELGYAGNQGLLQKVKEVVDKVHNLPYISNIHGASELITDKRNALDQLESDIARLITDNTQLSDPGIIKGKVSFEMSSVSTPIGPWQDNKQVSYAIQLVSENGLSRVGEWSTPYTVQNKACPIVMLPTVEYGLVRLVYRRFNEEKPELVAVLSNHTESVFRDIGRDLLNAAGKPNEDLSVKETTLLLNDGADTNVWIENKMTPLHYAAKHGNVKVMELLMERGADVRAKSTDNEEPLHFAAIFGTQEGIEYLISKGANINAQTKGLGLSALHIAVANNHVDAAKALIRKNAFINIKDNYGLTPLHMSIAGNGDTMDVLLESATIDLNIAAEDGLTPLHYAARSTSEVFVQKLLQHKDANANILTDSQVSPLHFAAMNGQTLIMAELIQQGAVISARDEDGSTPLHYAAFYGNRNAALKFMEIDPSLANVKNYDDKTPLDFAVENNRPSVIEVLQSDVDKLVQIIQQVLQSQNKTHQPLGNNSIIIKPEDETPTNCSKHSVDQMAIGSEETCTHMQNIETYVNLVMSMIPLEIYYENYEDFTQMFRNYDRDLRVAQEHAKIWRNGESIVQGIRQTFELAREFEPEFKEKYKTNKERVKRIKKSEDQVRHIKQTKDDILSLEEELQRDTKMRDRTLQLGLEDSSEFLDYLNEKVNNTQRKLDEKNRMLKEDFSLILELDELIAFLEFVRSDSTKIREVALRTKEKVETFRDNLDHDKSAFERHGRIAAEKIDQLESESIKNNNTLSDLKRNQEELERKIENEHKKAAVLYDQITESNNRLYSLQREILDNMEKARVRVIVGAVFTPFIIGIPILVQATNEQKELAHLEEKAIASNKQQIDLLNYQISQGRREITYMREQIANSSTNSDKVKLEMNVFITLDGDLKILSFQVKTLLEAIEKAIVGVKIIKDVFDNVTKKLTEMIDLAKTAKTEAERMNARYFIYNELSLLECNWMDIYWKVMNLDTCTRTFQILY